MPLVCPTTEALSSLNASYLVLSFSHLYFALEVVYPFSDLLFYQSGFVVLVVVVADFDSDSDFDFQFDFDSDFSCIFAFVCSDNFCLTSASFQLYLIFS